MKTESKSTISRLEAKIKRLEATLAAFQTSLELLEKRMLLRLRGEKFCRVCGVNSGRGDLHNPPLSKLEKTFCKANHGLGAKPKPKKPQRLPLNWEEVERLAR